MKNRLFTFAGALVLLAVLGKFYAVPVLAQVRSALVKNIDERGRIPYTLTVFCSSNGSTQCSAFFPAVPANKRLVIEHVNGSIDTPTNLSVVDFSGNGTFQNIFFQFQGLDLANNNNYISNQPFLTYFEAGQTPVYTVVVHFGAPVFISAQVTITGYLVDLTQ
jgi:hypothetical protein